MDAMSRRMSELFSPAAPRLYTIPPGENFLGALAKTLAEATGLKKNPEALADTLIYVPNSRSKTALAFALFEASGRGACLLPDIRALGDLESDEAPPGFEAVLADLPPAMPSAQRIGELTRLVLEYYRVQGLTIPATSALAAARELARLLDQAALSGDVDWSALETVVTDSQLAQHWAQSLAFLKIITAQWPVKLTKATQMDPYARRFAAAEAMVCAWQATPPKTPVLIAGSTGATPASRALMLGALQLPKGRVILPGLDRTIPEGVWQDLPDTPSHPQFALARTLKTLDVAPHEVALWPGIKINTDHTARRRLIHEALAPAASTADWTERLRAIAPDGDTQRFVTSALSGLTLVETQDDSDEAFAAALLLRETLETPGQTAALVTPDAGLARHVCALMKRWDIEVAPSSGLPLLQTDAGSFAGLTLDWLTDPSHPVKLLAVLKHAYSRFDQDQVLRMDAHILRGPRHWTTLKGLRENLETKIGLPAPKHARYTDEDLRLSIDILSDLERALETSQLSEPAPETILGGKWYAAGAEVMAQLSRDNRPWTGGDGGSLATLFGQLAELSDPLGLQPPRVLNDLFKAEATQITVSMGAAHPRLAIWGPLEARLQAADRIILAGLNEGVWPAQAAADAFLPRVFRAKMGLSDPDERIGLSAHDFAQLAAAPDVTLLTSKRRDDKPAVASRWLWRLRTLVRGALGKDGADLALAPDPTRDPLHWIQLVERAPELPAGFTANPRPCPPRAARPSKLSVTRIESLIRDPYAIYSQYVLGLYKLDQLDMPVDARERGTAIHAALEQFELSGFAPDDVAGLVSLIEAKMRDAGEPDALIIALHHKRLEVAANYLKWREDTAPMLVAKALTEEEGAIALDIAGEPFTLTGTADRIEQRRGGKTAILDFKTGAPPSEKQVRSGLAPQMPLQGLIAQRGGYEALGKADIDALTYIQFGTKFEVREIGNPGKKDEKPVADIIAETAEGLTQLLTQFADPQHPYLSAPQPERVIYESDYTRLARRQEWLGLRSYD